MIKPKLKGKQIKDYLFGDSLAVFEQGSQVAKAVKSGKMNLTVYGIANTLIDPQSFPIYNNEIAANPKKIYPIYYENVRSQNFLYMIFEELIRPQINPNSKESVNKLLHELQKLLFTVQHKLSIEQIFMRTNGSGQLCIIIPYTKNLQKTSNLYSKYHNKSILAELFCEVVPTKDKTKVTQVFIQNVENKDLFQKLEPYLNIKTNPQNNKIQPQKHIFANNPHQPSTNNPTNTHKNLQKGESNAIKSNQNNVMKSNANKLIKQVQSQYPDIDEKQYEELMAYVHVNPNLKHQAGQAYMRQSAKVRKQEAENQISEIVNNVNTSLFNVTKMKGKDGRSKVQIKLNKKKMQITQFQVHFDAYYSVFKLFKLTIRSFLQKYKNGFAGIIAAYMITLIGILRRLQLYNDLSIGQDVFEIGGHVHKMNFEKFTNLIRKDLAKEARNLANLKNIIENANMPYKTYEALTPYLEEDLQLIDLNQTQNFCFFYMTILMRMAKGFSYHDILSLEVMYVLISPFYSIVYSQEEMPKVWDSKYFQLRKVLISTLIPQWEI